MLWCAIAALAGSRDARRLRVIVYCGDDPEEWGIDRAVGDAGRRFGITIPRDLDLRLVYVRQRALLEPQRYPRFTMLGQALGSARLAWECLRADTPDVFIDTIGAPFALPVAKLLAGCRVAAYVHYPTITTDMIGAVESRRPSYNNTAAVSRSRLATAAKLLYYRAFAAAYAVAGGFADAVMANGSWTCGHLQTLWLLPSPPLPDGAADADAVDAGAGAGADAVGGDDGLPVAGAGAGVSLLRSLSTGGPLVPSEERAATAAALAEASYRPVLGVLPSLARAFGLWASSPAYRRPAARVVFPPCNTELLAALPLGWSYAASAGAASAGGTAAAATWTGDDEASGAAGAAPSSRLASAADADDAGSGDGAAAASGCGDSDGDAAGSGAAAAIAASPASSAAAAGASGAASVAAAAASSRFSTTRSRLVVSVAQFRPEKDHALQIRAFAAFKRRDPAAFADVRLHLIGGVRDAGDEARLASLKALAASPELGLPAGSVDFRPNIPLADLRAALGAATAGLHSMWNEHFGIGVVEMMAAGVITVAHDSGGPRCDIVRPFHGAPTGFLAGDEAAYADALEVIFRATGPKVHQTRCSSPAVAASLARFDPVAMTAAARASTGRFSDEEFALGFLALALAPVQDGLEDAAARAASDKRD